MGAESISIFVIEDDDVDFKILKHEFAKNKIINPIVRAKDGLDGIEQLTSGAVSKPYVILLDLNMPRMSGMEFLDALRNNEEHEDAVVFVLTTSADIDDIRHSYEKHAAGYFLKDDANLSIERLVEVLGG